MSWVVDRIEGEFAIIHSGEFTFEVPIAALPEGLEEGSLIVVTVDIEGTRTTHAAAKARIQALAQDDDGQDFSL